MDFGHHRTRFCAETGQAEARCRDAARRQRDSRSESPRRVVNSARDGGGRVGPQFLRQTGGSSIARPPQDFRGRSRGAERQRVL
uniref:Uncharacterized protein n=1 Tax=Rhodopseudomonas palustris (strain BisA53) TaxID=316055 RepID=Q07VN1_RHOP5